MANMEYRRPYRQAQGSSYDPWWTLICGAIIVALALAGLPWIILGFVVQRYLQRWLDWRVSFLIWLALLLAGGATLHNSLLHGGLDSMIGHELGDYIAAVKTYQYDLAHYPLRQLWADTWPVWLHTWPGIGIAGFVGELVANRNNTVRNLRDTERRRQQRAQRFQHRARRRTSRPARIADEVGNMMVIGVPIRDDEEEE